MIKDCRDCKFCQTFFFQREEWCRLYGKTAPAARAYYCGISDAKHFTPKKRLFKKKQQKIELKKIDISEE